MKGMTKPDMMKAARLHEPGEAGSITVDVVPVPRPARGEILVEVHAAAITRDELTWPSDRLPAVPSYELSGTVAALGDDVAGFGFEPGDDVYALTDFERNGVAAEYAVVAAAELSSKPRTLTHAEAAAIPLPGLSAMQGLFEHGRLARNERVLIHGGAGGVGAFAVQLARLHGAYVIATASASREAIAHLLGADEVLVHPATDFTAIEPVDLVFDTAGGERLERSVGVLGKGGRLVSVADDPPAEASEAGIDATWFLVESNLYQLAELSHLADTGALRVFVERACPLSEARDAFAYLMARGGTGKVVLTVIEE